MPTYLGNPSLSNAVKDRVISTFQQTLSLYKQGRSDEAMSGCNLMLQMDPMFEPARKLVEKMRNPNASIDVDTLLPNSDDDALREARTAMAQRDFPRVVQITTEILTNDLMNDAARILADEARDKLEAAPFVEQFVSKCEKSLNAGDMHGAKTALEKARALDAEHPAISKMSQMINARGASAPAPAAPAASGFDFGTSFVVDAPPPAVPGRGTAQATDFGFTFEEEKPQPADGGLTGFSFDTPEPAPPPAPKPAPPPAPAPPQPPKSNDFSFDAPSADAPFAGFSFDSPTPAPTPAAGGFDFDAGAAAPKTPVTGDFDFATASIETSAEDQKKIGQYMTDGDRAFEAADYQKAIDLWSRIFLIDVTNEQASERIERAKQKRKEIEQQNESILAAGIAAFDRNDRETARGKFAEVLRNEPNNITAQDYMDRLSDTVTEGGAAGYESSYTPPDTEKFDIFAEEPPSSGDMLIPPDAVDEDEAALTPTTKKGVAKKTGGVSKSKPAPVRKPLPLGLIATIIGVLVVVGGGWFAWQKFSKPAVDTTSTDQVISRAQGLAGKGKYDQAILMLQDIKPDDPQHDKALLMINDIQKKKAQASEMIDGRPAALVYQEGLANGKTLYDSHDYDGAKKAFEAAMKVKALTPEMKTLYDTASQKVAKLDSAKSLFNEHQYSDALANLQQLQQDDPENKNIQRLIEDAHFNLGAVALQNENLTDAVKQFDEVLKLDPADDLAKRSRELAMRYQSEPKDLLYRIYVKYLPLRTAA